MVKGISHQVVELTVTGSPYFERAWLVVRADCIEKSSELLSLEGQRVLRHAAPHTGLRLARRRRVLETAASAFVAAGGGMLLGWLLR
ncbi:MAG: hypothetical protein IJZ13_03275 [Clostridia bacterium]|nr:hypothetical protein [Clostridia bacterium]